MEENKQPKVVVSNGQPKDVLTEAFLKMKEKALLSPILAHRADDSVNLAEFTEKISINNLYWIVIGITVNFYEHPLLGSFYPNWIAQSAYFSKAKRLPVKLNLLTGRQRNDLVNLHHRVFQILSSWDRAQVMEYRSVNRTIESLEWRVPFSEEDINLLDGVFIDLIRRSGNGNV